MSEKKKRSRRVVSKREYVSFLSQKTIIGSVIILLMSLGIVAGWGALAILSFLANIHTLNEAHLVMFFLAFSSWFLFRSARTLTRDMKNIPPVTPLTRHNTTDLPEPETLVRASEEPPAHQAEVLLRAAQEGQETPEEQLLRPVDK